MLSLSKKDNAVYILYAAISFNTTKTVTAKIWDDTNTQIVGSPISLSQIPTNTGLYGASFTPTTVGEYKIEILENGSVKAAAGIKVTEYDIESIGGDVVSIKTILEHTTYGNEAIVTKLTDIAGTSFVSADDSLKAIKDFLVNTIQSSIAQIQNNTLTSVSLSTEMLRPASSSTPFKVFVNVYDTEGLMQDPDDQDSGAGIAMLAVSVLDESGNGRNDNLSGLDASTQDSKKWMTKVSTGRFSCIYDVASTADLEQLNFTFTYKVGGNERVLDRSSVVTETVNLSTVVNNTYDAVTNATYGLSALKTLIDSYQNTNQASFDTLSVQIDDIDTAVGTNYSLLANGTYGLSALKGLVDILQTNVTSIQGTGFVSSTDSLTAVSTRQQTIMGAGFDSDTDTLEKLRDAVDNISMTGGYIA